MNNYGGPKIKDIDILHFVSGLTVKQLLEFLGPKYHGPKDLTSLIFAVVTGKSTHTVSGILETPEYQHIIRLLVDQVYEWSRKIYRIMDTKRYFPPPIYLANLMSVPIQKIFSVARAYNVDKLLNKYGIIFDENGTVNFTKPWVSEGSGTANRSSPVGKLTIFMWEMRNYDPILYRPIDSPQPPPLYILLSGYVAEQLSMYTLKELDETYNLNKS